MRVLCFLFLAAFVAAIGVFCYQNQEELSLMFWDRTLTAPLPIIIGAVYLLGMLSGWTVVGMLRRSVDRVIEQPGHARTYS